MAPGAHTGGSDEFGIFANTSHHDSIAIQFGDDTPRAGIALETQPRLSSVGGLGVYEVNYPSIEEARY